VGADDPVTRPSRVRQRSAEARWSDGPTPRESPSVDYDRLRRELDHRRVVSSRYASTTLSQFRFRARHRSAAGPVLDLRPARRKTRTRSTKAQRLDQEQPQANHIAEQDAVLPSVRAEHALMNLRGSLFCALAAARIRPSRRDGRLRLHSQRAARRSMDART